MGRKALIASGCLAALLIAFAVGRYTRPARVETREVVKWQTREVVREKAAQVVTVTKTEAGKVRTLIKEVFIKAPDGTERLETTTQTGTDTTATTGGTSTATSETARDTSASGVHEAVRIETWRPDWSADIAVGYTWKEPALDLGNDNVAAEVTVTRHIAGPVSAGVRASSMGAVMLVAGVEW